MMAGRPEDPGRAPRLCGVIPCYNVAALCGPVVRAAAAHCDWVLAVDDGSRDRTGEVLRDIAAGSEGRVRLISFERNRGKGHALLAAFREALRHLPFDLLVTMDGDAQHRPDDIPRVAAACRGGADLAIGTRRGLSDMPFRSRLGNGFTTAFVRHLHRHCPPDTQSGFRAMRHSFVEEIVERVPGGRYETEMRVLLLALRSGRPIVTVEIPTIYFGENRSSHYRPFRDSLRIASAVLGPIGGRGRTR